MTLVVAVMNRKGLALASDTAVCKLKEGTYKRVENRKKIFSLTFNQPIAIMIYGNPIMGDQEYETIIKQYREETKEVDFNSIDECCSNFFSYLDCFAKKTHIDNDGYKEAMINLSNEREEVLNDINNERNQLVTGIVIAGIGSNDEGPILKSYKVLYNLSGEIIYQNEKDSRDYRDTESNGKYYAFGTTEILDMCIQGIDPRLKRRIQQMLSQVKEIKQYTGQHDEEDNEQCKLENLQKYIEEAKWVKTRLGKVNNVIEKASLEKLLEIAQSMIKITCDLVTVFEDIESVGTPIQSLTISKSLGLVWNTDLDEDN